MKNWNWKTLTHTLYYGEFLSFQYVKRKMYDKYYCIDKIFVTLNLIIAIFYLNIFYFGDSFFGFQFLSFELLSSGESFAHLLNRGFLCLCNMRTRSEFQNPITKAMIKTIKYNVNQISNKAARIMNLFQLFRFFALFRLQSK